MARFWTVAVIAAFFAGLVWPVAASASCIPQTPEQQLRNADVVFIGVALEGPTESGVQRFRVDRYVKGSGADVVAVATGVIARADGTGSTTSVSVEAAADERWRIYATQRVDGVAIETSVCAGSVKLPPASRRDAEDSPTAVSSSAEAAPFDNRLAVAFAVLVLVLLAISAALLTRSRRRTVSHKASSKAS
jgi:hypothetical protein